MRAAKLVENDCDAVDLNLGCPQNIAKRGHYGSYLQDEWELIEKMVSTLHRELAIPVTVKIRCFPTIEKTIAYAKMIEAAGAQMLTVHGRLREQRGHNTGLADWDKIKAVKQALKIPVVANGNILYHEDIQRCIDYTGVDAVMTAEGSLYNPAIFSAGRNLPPFTFEVAEEYLDICKIEKTNPGMIKGHMFKLLHPSLPHHTDLRARLGKARELEEFYGVVRDLKERVLKEIEEKGEDAEEKGEPNEDGIRKYSYWRCQPYIRPKQVVKNDAKDKESNNEKKRNLSETSTEQDLESNKKLKETPDAPNAEVCAGC